MKGNGGSVTSETKLNKGCQFSSSRQNHDQSPQRPHWRCQSTVYHSIPVQDQESTIIFECNWCTWFCLKIGYPKSTVENHHFPYHNGHVQFSAYSPFSNRRQTTMSSNYCWSYMHIIYIYPSYIGHIYKYSKMFKHMYIYIMYHTMS